MDNSKISLSPVVVTGGCGFIGFHLVTGILQNEPDCLVHVIDTNTTRNRIPGVTYHTADISVPPDVERVFSIAKPKTVFHLACPDSMVKQPSVFRRVNVVGACNLVNEARKTAHALVNTTSSSVIHDNVSDLRNADESFPVLKYPAQKRVYSLTKAEADAIIMAANREGGDNVPSMLTVELRPATVFGPRDTVCMGKIVANARAGKANIQMGPGSNYYDFVYVSNYVDANILAAKALLKAYGKPPPANDMRVDGEAFNVTNDEPVEFWEFQRGIAASVGLPVRDEDIKIIPVWMALFFALLSEWTTWIRTLGKGQPIVTREAVRLTTITRTMNCNKIKRVLGYKPKERANIRLAKDYRVFGWLLPGWPYIWRGPKILLDNYISGVPLAIRTRETYYIHFSSLSHMSELRDAPEEQLSLHALSKDVFRPDYTMNGLEIDENMRANGSAHFRAFRVILPSQLQSLGPDLFDLLGRTFDDEFRKIVAKSQVKHNDSWSRITIFDVAKRVLTAASAYVFFGVELGTDPSFVQAALEYPEDVFLTSEVLGFVPSFLQPFVAPKLMRNHKASNLLVNHLMPVVEKRLRQARLDDEEGYRGAEQQQQPRPRDCIQFLIDSSNRDRDAWTAERIVQVLLGIWFAAVHQPALAAVYALENLCRHGEFVEPLREEISSSFSSSNSSSPLASAIDKAPLLDAFLKESSRFHPSDSISARRKVLTPFTFKDGTHILPGDVACVPLQAIMQDEHYYPNSHTFDPYRFITTNTSPCDDGNDKENKNDKGKDGHSSQHYGQKKRLELQNTSRFTDADFTYPLWGLGKHSCPARFYASVLLKLFLAHLLTHYDIQLPEEGNGTKTSRTFFYRSAIMPKPGCFLMFRKREELVM
ncbi:Cytochrome P450 [Naviculisporaceae sp. PSN 640]